MDTPYIADRLERFVRQSFQVADDDPRFGRAVDLFASGYVDSIGVIETVTFITEAFGVDVPDEALLSKRFATLDGMAQTIAELMEEEGKSRAASAAKSQGAPS